MSRYTYTIFDGDPATGGVAWPNQTGVTLEAESDDEAVAQVTELLEDAAAELSVLDAYDPGDVVYSIVWREDGTVVGSPTHVLSVKDLDVDKRDASDWETVATCVAAFGREGAVDVDVQVGHCGTAWYFRTADIESAEDEAPDDVYDSREAAVAAAKAFATAENVAEEGENAESYLRRLRCAANYLGATRLPNQSWAYFAHETGRWYVIGAAALANLVRYLNHHDPAVRSDAYSRWCADTSASEMPEGWEP